jgi:hypothetical protein
MTMSDEDADQLLVAGIDVICQFFRLGAVSEEVDDNHILPIGYQISVNICLPFCITLDLYHGASFRR